MPVAVLFCVVLAGCSTGDPVAAPAPVTPSTPAASSSPAATGPAGLTVWTLGAAPVPAQQAFAAGYTKRTGTTVALVPVPADQLAAKLAAAAAAHQLPDVLSGVPLTTLRALGAAHRLDTAGAQALVTALRPTSFTPRALQLTRDGRTQLGVPSDGAAEMIIYRQDLVDRLGLDNPTTYAEIEKDARMLNGQNGVAGFAMPTSPGPAAEVAAEYLAQAGGCELVDGGGRPALGSPACVRALDFAGRVVREASAGAGQTADAALTAYLAGKVAILVAPSSALTAVTGQRPDAPSTCAECRYVPAFLAQNSGVVTAIGGADYGEIGSFALVAGGRSAPARAFVRYAMSTGYGGWLAQAPELMSPVRSGYFENWQKAKAGVKPAEALYDFYDPDVLQAVANSPAGITRWGISQGRAALADTVLQQAPFATALAAVIAGTATPSAAAAAAQRSLG